MSKTRTRLQLPAVERLADDVVEQAQNTAHRIAKRVIKRAASGDTDIMIKGGLLGLRHTEHPRAVYAVAQQLVEAEGVTVAGVDRETTLTQVPMLPLTSYMDRLVERDYVRVVPVPKVSDDVPDISGIEI